MAFSPININPGTVRPQPTKPVDCHPDSQCPECLPKPEPTDTFTPSEQQPMLMPDPSKYPDAKPAPEGRIGSSLKPPYFWHPMLK